VAENTLPNAKEGSFELYYKYDQGNAINKAIHSGVRLGGFVLPYSLGLAGVALGFSVNKNMQLQAELDKTKKSLSTARKKAKGYSSRRAKKSRGGKYSRP